MVWSVAHITHYSWGSDSSVKSSVLQYVRPSDLKKDLNSKFRERFPDLDPSLSLSKIRHLKQQLLDIAVGLQLEIATVACAYVYFEKLVMKVSLCTSHPGVALTYLVAKGKQRQSPRDRRSLPALVGESERAETRLPGTLGRDRERA